MSVQDFDRGVGYANLIVGVGSLLIGSPLLALPGLVSGGALLWINRFPPPTEAV